MLKKLFPLFLLLLCVKIKAQNVHLMAKAFHPTRITGGVVTNNGRFIITVSSDNTAILWNARTGVQLSIFRPVGKDMTEEGSQNTPLLSPDERTLLIYNDMKSGGYGKDGPVVCRVSDLSKIGNLASAITFAVFSPDGKYIAGADDFGGLRVYNATNLQLLHEFNVFNSSPLASIDFAALKKDPSFLKDKDKLHKYIEGVTQKSEKAFNNAQSETNSLHISADSKFVIISGTNKTATIWNIETGNQVILTGHTDEVNDAEFSTDGKFVVTAANDHTIKVWNAGSGRCLRTITLNFSIKTAFFNPTGDLIIAFSDAGNENERYPEVFSSKDGHKIRRLDHMLANFGVYSPDGKYLITTNSGSECKIWDASTFTSQSASTEIGSVQYSANGKYMVLTSPERAELWDAIKMENINQFKGFDRNGHLEMQNVTPDNIPVLKDDKDKTNPVMLGDPTSNDAPNTTESPNNYNYSPDKQFRFETNNVSGSSVTQIINNSTGKSILSFKGLGDTPFPPMFFSPNSKLVAVCSYKDTTVKIIDLKTGKTINSIPGIIVNPYVQSSFSPDSKFILISRTNKNAKVTGNAKPMAITNSMSVADLLEMGLKNSSGYGPSIINVQTGATKSVLEGFPGTMFTPLFSPPNPDDPNGGKYLVTTGYSFTAVATVNIWETATGKLISTLKTDATIKRVLFSPDAKFIFTDSDDNTFRQWSTSTGKFLSTFYPGKNGAGGFQLSADGYYTGDKKAIQNMYYVTKDFKIVGANQLDIKYNRPDKILDITGSTDNALKNSYKQAYLTRLKSLHTDSAAVNKTQILPEIKILNEDYTVNRSSYKLHIQGTSSSTALQKLDVWVNNVPIYGTHGLSLPKGKKQIDTTVNIELSDGYRYDTKNTIEASVTNASNAESYRAQLVLSYKTDYGPYSHVYFIGIGINNYADKNENLKWSVNDIRRMAQGLKMRHDNNITIDTLFNGNVTRANIQALKKHLKNLGVEDRMIIAYSGHGINTSSGFFLPTYHTNFNKPENNSIPYTDLESLLDEIAPRQKLILIDACNSGNYDKSSSVNGLAKQSARAKTLSKNSFELMRDIFTNVEKGTGATVIASCGASRLSMENDTLKHSIFIYSVLESIFNDQHYVDFLNVTPKHSGRPWSLSALMDYLDKRLPELSDHEQQPIIRTENVAIDWDIWNY